MKIELEQIRIEQKPAFIRMMQLYLYDFSEFSHDDLNRQGEFEYPYIDAYWEEEGRFPFFIKADGKFAGLVLVRSCSEYNELCNPHNIAEFFVMKKYRRAGIGKRAAELIFDMFPGTWEISVWKENIPAQKFWEKAINEYTDGKFRRFYSEENQITGSIFDNSSEI